VLEADRIGDEEECALRDHLVVVHPRTILPETRSALLRHFVVSEPPADSVDGPLETSSRRPGHDDSWRGRSSVA